MASQTTDATLPHALTYNSSTNQQHVFVQDLENVGERHQMAFAPDHFEQHVPLAYNSTQHTPPLSELQPMTPYSHGYTAVSSALEDEESSPWDASHAVAEFVPAPLDIAGPATTTAPPYPRHPQPASPPATVPPNGGLSAWLQVLGAFFLFFNSWGLVNTFGVFQEYYKETFLSSFEPSSISWIGTVQGFLLIFIGVLSGPLYDLGFLRSLMVAGTGSIFLGLLVVAEVQSFFGIFLSLSLLVGLGAGCLFVPSVAIVAQYFTTKRPLATGIAAAGGSFGGVVFPIVFRAALDNVGYPWACRILGFIVLGSQVIPILVLVPRVPGTGEKRALLELTAFRDALFWLFSLGLFFTFIGLYIPFYYLPTYGREKLGVSSQLSNYVLAVMNAGSIFGRIILNLVAIYAGSLNALVFVTFTSGILAFFWISVQNLTGLVGFAILYGFFSGAVVSLPPTALVSLSPDLTKIGTRLGMSFSFAGFGLLVGNPIAGVFLSSQFSFVGQQVFSAVVIFVGFILLMGSLLTHLARNK